MRFKARGSWLASGVVHVLLVFALALGVAERGGQRVTFITFAAPRAVSMPDAPVTTPNRIPRPEPQLVPFPKTPEPGTPPPEATPPPPVPVPAGKPEPGRNGTRTLDALVAGAIAAGGVNRGGDEGGQKATPGTLGAAAGPIIASPKLSDARIWPQARPALPSGVADALYGARRDSLPRDSVAIHRLKAMVDSLNVVVDAEQRARRKPSWVGEVGGKKFGMDSSSIYIAGVKIPNAVLAMLGNMLPQGNFDESLRERELQYMSEDIMQAARRAETMQDFRRYVREERASKQAQRDFERRQREGDTVKTKAKRDTLTP